MGNGFTTWFSRSYKGIIIGLATFGVAMLVVLAMQHASGSVAVGATAGPIPTFTSPASKDVRFAVIGDSVTAANSPDIDNGKAGDGSWAYYASQDGARLVGGWALGGATTEAMLRGAGEYDADVLVLLAGTNDSGQKMPFTETASNLKQIVEKTGVPKVVVSSIPPRDDDPAIPTAYNAQLQALALDEGWTYVDGASALRDGDSYRSGFTSDGIHPTPAGAQALGKVLRQAIIAAA